MHVIVDTVPLDGAFGVRIRNQ